MSNRDSTLFVLQLEGVPLSDTAILRQGWESVVGFVDWCIRMDDEAGSRPDARDRSAVAAWLRNQGYILHVCRLDPVCQ